MKAGDSLPPFSCSIDGGWNADLLPDDSGFSSQKRDLGSIRLFRVVQYRRLRIVWILTLFFGAMIAAYFNFIAVFAKNNGYSGLNSFFVFYAIAAVGIRTIGAKYPDRYGIGPFLKGTIAVYGLGIFLIGWANGPLMFSVAGFLCGFGHGYLFPILNMMVVHRCQDADRGAAVTAYAAALDLGMFLGAPSMGWFAEKVSTAAMFQFSALIFLLVGVLFFLIDPKFRSAVSKTEL